MMIVMVRGYTKQKHPRCKKYKAKSEAPKLENNSCVQLKRVETKAKSLDHGIYE